MADRVQLEIVTPYGQIINEEVDEVNAVPGSDGEFGVFPGHAPFVTTLRIGILSYKSGNETKLVFVNSGYAEVSADRVTILADSAERAEDIDIERALEAKKRAEERLRQAEQIDFVRAQASLERATTRIHIAQR